MPTPAKPKSADRLAFTKRTIETLTCPADVDRVYYYDAGQANLALCITRTGRRTFFRTGRIKGRSVRLKLGPWPELSVERARKMASEHTGNIASGKDPHAERLALRREHTIAGLFAHWLEFAKPRKKTWKDDERQFKKYLSPLHSRRLSTVKRSDVQSLHSKIGKDHGPYTANRVLALLRAAFNRAADIGWDGPNPTKGVAAFREQSRDRFLSPAEVPAFFAALANEPEIFQDLFWLCLLTGARRSNVQSMDWASVDLDANAWRIPDTKSGEPVHVHLPAKAIQILQQRREAAGDSPWVFPGGKKNRSGHLTSPKGSWDRVRKAANLPDLRIHDLRRTLGSWQAIAGTSLPIIGKSLGHKSQASTAVYARLTQAPVVQSVDAATTAIMAAAGLPETAAAVPETAAAANETTTPAQSKTRKAQKNGGR